MASTRAPGKLEVMVIALTHCVVFAANLMMMTLKVPTGRWIKFASIRDQNWKSNLKHTRVNDSKLNGRTEAHYDHTSFARNRLGRDLSKH